MQLLSEDNKMDEIFHKLGLNRYCCRRMIISHVDLIEKLLKYNSKLNNILKYLNYYFYYHFSLF